MLKRCPFYGFRWPERSANLVQVGGSECGLDLEGNGSCKMEALGFETNFHRCEIAAGLRVFLLLAAHRTRFFPDGDTQGIPFEEWSDLVMSGQDNLSVCGLAHRGME